MRHAPWVLAALVLLLPGCGGGDVTWCFNSGSGAVSAGTHIDDCPPRPDNSPQPAAQ